MSYFIRIIVIVNRTLRLRILHKIAQTTTTPTAAVKAPADGSGSASDLMPTLLKGYNPHQIEIINNLVARLSGIVNQQTMGQYNFQKLKNANFSFDPSAFPDPNTKNTMLFFQQVYKTLLNSGNAFQQAVQAQQISSWTSTLMNSSNLNQISGVEQTGLVAQQMPGNNDLIQTIKNSLTQLQSSSIQS